MRVNLKRDFEEVVERVEDGREDNSENEVARTSLTTGKASSSKGKTLGPMYLTGALLAVQTARSTDLEEESAARRKKNDALRMENNTLKLKKETSLAGAVNRIKRLMERNEQLKHLANTHAKENQVRVLDFTPWQSDRQRNTSNRSKGYNRDIEVLEFEITDLNEAMARCEQRKTARSEAEAFNSQKASNVVDGQSVSTAEHAPTTELVQPKTGTPVTQQHTQACTAQ